MRKGLILLLAAMLCNTARADGEAVLYFADAAVMPGGRTSLELHMRSNLSNLTCIEAEVQLPEGLSAVLDEDGDPAVTLLRNRSTEHEVLSNVLSNGNVKVLVSNIDGAVFRGTDGPILSISVQADKAAPIGECTVETVGESLIVSTDAEAYYSVGVTGTILITDDATALRQVQAADDDAIYNLAGQRIASPKSGIHVQKGRKTLYK